MSRFVSGGTISSPTDEASTSTQPAVNDSLSSERDAAWTQAQAAIDATRQAKKSDAGSGMQEGGKSLYETLQANKAQKQEAFESSARLSNQFRALDEDEATFLSTLSATARAQEAALAREQAQELEAFRRRREEVERSSSGGAGTTDAADEGEDDVGGSWAGAGGRKRKKGRERGLVVGVKVRRMSSTTSTEGGEGRKGREGGEGEDGTKTTAEASPVAAQTKESNFSLMEQDRKVSSPAASASPPPSAKQTTQSPSPPPTTGGLGLGAYSSDEDE